jgi:RHS repeat-associated protein
MLIKGGSLYAVGANFYGELGNGQTGLSASVQQVLGLSGTVTAASPSAGERSLAVLSNGSLWGWGNDIDGELGHDVQNSVGIQLPGPPDGTTDVAAGGFHNLALQSDGSVWAWGANWSGQLGDGTTDPRSSPVQVSGLSSVIQVAAGTSHSLALRSDGTVWSWGANGNGQLGNGTTAEQHSPTQVPGLSGIVAVAAGDGHSLALRGDGTVWTWGANFDGQLGDGSTTERHAPVQVAGLITIASIGGGANHTLAVKSDGTVWAWGNNGDGELGIGNTSDQSTPTQMATISGATAVAGGDFHSLVLLRDGTVWGTGNNSTGQLGDGTTTNHSSPVQTAGGLTGIVAVSAGSYHSLALKNDGTVWTWGANWQGQLGGWSNVNQSLPIQAWNLVGQGAVSTSKEHALTTAPSRGWTSVYVYDRLYRLTGVSSPAGTVNYGYDPLGNRLSKVANGSATSYTYDRADRILSSGTTNYTVNNAGNQTARGSDSFVYDQANRLTSTTTSTGSGAYAYDGDGKRVSKTVGGVTTSYVYDVGAGLPVLLDDGASKYVWGTGGLAYSVDKSSTALVVYHADALGSIRATSDSLANVVGTFQTDEYGVPIASGTQGTTASFGFTGEQRDQESGLTNFRARLYDPSIGRFVQRDALSGILSLPQSLHRFTHAMGNPVLLVDPSGFSPVDEHSEYQDDCLRRVPGPVPATLINLLCTNLPIFADAPQVIEGPSGPVLVPGIVGITPPDGGGGRNDKFRGPTAKAFDWVHIFDNHAEWGGSATQRIAAAGRKAASIFWNMNAGQIKAAVQAAWTNRAKASEILDDPVHPGVTRQLYRGADPDSGLTIEMVFNRTTQQVETAYPVFK